MSFSDAVNTFIGSALIIILLYAECKVKYTTSRILKRRYSIFLFITFFSLITDFLFSVLKEIPQHIITEDNVIRIVINYMPILLAICVIISMRRIHKQYSFLIVLLLTFFTISMGFNIMAGSVKQIWPVLTALLLYTYLFIVLKETKADILTGLDNRHSFFEYTNRLARSKTGESWNIIILDIKNFKSINEIYGHLEGDTALSGLAEIIKNLTKKSGFAARYGGDEFAIITKAETNIQELMGKINEELEKLNEKSGKLYNIEVSYESGVFVADGNESIEKFLNNIDKLMHKHHEESRRATDIKAGVNT